VDAAAVVADRDVQGVARSDDDACVVGLCVPGHVGQRFGDDPIGRRLDVIDNLIGNAVKYTLARSVAEVRVSARGETDGTVRVEVADHGIGIPESDRPHVFDAFHRSANSGAYRGTGLGLAICRRIVERHHGRIGVEANAGGGSRFWFTLPA
jgi:signal transduction histidine kinase